MELTALDILTSDNKYSDRLKYVNATVEHNAEVLAVKVLELLQHYGHRPPISSGFRDPASNKKAGGSPKSAHCEGRAIDFEDLTGSFGKWCLKNVALLAALKLHIEDPKYTPGWLHITDRPPRSGKIVFIPR